MQYSRSALKLYESDFKIAVDIFETVKNKANALKAFMDQMPDGRNALTANAGAWETIFLCLSTAAHNNDNDPASDFRNLEIDITTASLLLEQSGDKLHKTVEQLALMAKSKGLKELNWRYVSGLMLADAANDFDGIHAFKHAIGLIFSAARFKEQSVDLNEFLRL
jgi:hypothetical protein